MAIYWICPSCNTPNSLNKKKCKCGTSYPKSGNRKFRVRVQINKRRLSRSAQTLAMAREIEIVLKEKLLKEKYFGKENKTSKITLNKFFCLASDGIGIFLKVCQQELNFEEESDE